MTLDYQEFISQENRAFANIKLAKNIDDYIKDSWKYIAPYWSLSNLIAINPLKGLEDLPFEQALSEGGKLFQAKNLPTEMGVVNRETIKWCQVLLDKGQASIFLPNTYDDTFRNWLDIIKYDKRAHHNIQSKLNWLKSLPSNPNAIIGLCLVEMDIPQKDWSIFLTLILTTLSGWSSYICYLNQWDDKTNKQAKLNQSEYLAIRLILTCLLYPRAKKLIEWYHEQEKEVYYTQQFFSDLEKNEQSYRNQLLGQVVSNRKKSLKAEMASAQFVFCIDVRSESMRRAIESINHYQTFSMAGFFGLSASIKNNASQVARNACPVLVEPQHNLEENFNKKQTRLMKSSGFIQTLYKRIKYNFATPFALAESLGLAYGFLLFAKTFCPKRTHHLIQKYFSEKQLANKVKVDLESISKTEQAAIAANVLKAAGLTKNLSKCVIFCGHHSTNVNNAYNSALQCGACGGHSGSSNAQIIAQILNDKEVRDKLTESNIQIPEDTIFVGASHNTTTDQISLFDRHVVKSDAQKQLIEQIAEDLKNAQAINSSYRAESLDIKSTSKKNAMHHTQRNAFDWAQVRPEWGLANNAAFIIGPRDLTKGIDLGSRTFLHSYDSASDIDFQILESIMTAPMVVAYWINSQYFFSSLNNVAYGAGSKVTKNITGHLGVMQGNASDLMNGLPSESVYRNSKQPYHELIRLQVIINAPIEAIGAILRKHLELNALCTNGWIHITCIDTTHNQIFRYTQHSSWEEIVELS